MTPFHFGPGVLLKAAGRRRFSLGTYVVVNVVIDVESAVNLLRGHHPIHHYLHSTIGALVVATIVAALAPSVLTWTYRRLQRMSWIGDWARKELGEVKLLPAATGAFLGALNQTYLDAIMHSDLMPWWPVDPTNPLQHDAWIVPLHLACIACFVVGAIAWLLPYARRGR